MKGLSLSLSLGLSLGLGLGLGLIHMITLIGSFLKKNFGSKIWKNRPNSGFFRYFIISNIFVIYLHRIRFPLHKTLLKFSIQNLLCLLIHLG
jgi:hypothetical protein